MKKNSISYIKDAVNALDQTSLFGDSADREKDLVKACVIYLKEKGYSIHKTQEVYKNISNTTDLVKLFYARLMKHLNNTHIYRNSLTRDLTTAKRFVESRMTVSNLDKSAALQECAKIIDAIFDHYDKFGFKYQINFSIFGQQKMAWVTERAVQFINEAQEENKQKRRDDIEKEILKEKEKECDTSIEELDAIIAHLEGK